jgi:hypothetical protein
MKLILILSALFLSACAGTNWQNLDVSPMQDMLNYQSNQRMIQQQAVQPTKQVDRQCFSDCETLGYTRSLCESRCSYQ